MIIGKHTVFSNVPLKLIFQPKKVIYVFFVFFLILFCIVINSLGSEVGHCVIQFQSINLNPSYTKRKRKNILADILSEFRFYVAKTSKFTEIKPSRWPVMALYLDMSDR